MRIQCLPPASRKVGPTPIRVISPGIAPAMTAVRPSITGQFSTNICNICMSLPGFDKSACEEVCKSK